MVEHTMNKPSPIKPEAEAWQAPQRPRARVSDRLFNPSVEAAPQSRSTRHDGWTPERQRLFLEALSQCGVVEDAARAAGMSKQSAYAFRNRAAGRGFHLGWLAAQQMARHSLADMLMSRAIHGTVDVIVRDGQVWGERHRFDNRLSIAMLTKLEQKHVEQGTENLTSRHVAEEYDEFLDVLESGEEGALAAFVAERKQADLGYVPCKESRLLDRLARYQAEGSGLDLAAEQEAKARRIRESSPFYEPDEDEDEDEEGEEEDAEHEADGGGWQPSTSSTSQPAEAGPNKDSSFTADQTPTFSSGREPASPPQSASQASQPPKPAPEPAPPPPRRRSLVELIDDPNFDSRGLTQGSGGPGEWMR